MTDHNKMEQEMTYEKASARLEEIVTLLEKGSLPLDDTVKLYEEGSRLADYCEKALNEAQLRVTALQKKQEEP